MGTTRGPVTTGEYSGFVQRVLRAYGRRVGAGDVAALLELGDVAEQAEQALAAAVRTLRAEPWCYSWAEIGQALGVSRQAAQQRFGRVF